jgi:putative SbcD/Mre11-related phosphoesterase
MRVLTDWLLTPRRAALHVPTATAVIADLHLGYDAVRRRSGDAIPTFGLDEVTLRLAALRSRDGMRRLVIAGDLFQDGRDSAQAEELLAWLRTNGVELQAVVPGNHDRGLTGCSLPLAPDGASLGDWRVVHGDQELPPGRLVLGHFHPCLRRLGRSAWPCFLVRDDRLVLPAFSADTAGANVSRAVCWRGYRCFAIAGDRIVDAGLLGTARSRRGTNK